MYKQAIPPNIKISKNNIETCIIRKKYFVHADVDKYMVTEG